MSPNPKKLFVSHADEDREVAFELSKYLEQDGFRTFVTSAAMANAIDSKANLYESVAELRAVIILLTPHSLIDEHVKRETNLAIENGIPIYPVNLSGEDQLKKLLTPEWRYWLSITQILTCNDAWEALRKLRFRIAADTASSMEVDSVARQSIIGAWRVVESLFGQFEKAKMSHGFVDFPTLHSQFDNEVSPGFIEFSKGFKVAERDFRIDNRFSGKVLFGLFAYMQYFDCHSLTVNRVNSCGLLGHEIETLIDRYVKPSAIYFEYPSAITWYAETQFLWNHENFLEVCPALLDSEKFSMYKEILALDYQTSFESLVESENGRVGSGLTPKLALESHIFDELCKCLFYGKVSILVSQSSTLIELESAMKSITEFLECPEFVPRELQSLALHREDYQFRGYSMLLLLRAYLLRLLGHENEASIAIQEICSSDQNLIKDFLTSSIPASNGIGKDLLHQLAGFFQEYYEGDFPAIQSLEDNVFDPSKKTFFVAEQLYFFADRFNDSGDSDSALDLWSKSARGGFIPGLTSYTWATLQEGAFAAGVALFEECSKTPCEPEFESERLNAKGNYLLNKLAIDSDYAGTIESFKALILEEGDNSSFINHITLTCLEFLHGDPENAVRVFESIPAHVLTQLRQAYEDEAARAKGWQLDWCLQVLRAIGDVSRKS